MLNKTFAFSFFDITSMSLYIKFESHLVTGRVGFTLICIPEACLAMETVVLPEHAEEMVQEVDMKDVDQIW